MGQYYKPINLDDKQWLYTHDYDTGLKLMEHSWIGNQFVGTVMSLMLKGGLWFKKRIVWAGDYYGDQGEAERMRYRQSGHNYRRRSGSQVCDPHCWPYLARRRKR